MPYVEGFGTWPFGEEWLWEAIATSYLPLLDVLAAPGGQHVTLSITPVLADQLEVAGALRALRDLPGDDPARVAPARRRGAGDGRPARRWRPSWSARPPSTPRRRAGCASSRAPAAGCWRRWRPTSSWTSSATHAILPLLATDAGAAAPGPDGSRLAPAPVRRLARRVLAARVRPRAVARRAARGRGGARHLRGADRRLRARRPAPSAAAARPPTGRCCGRLTARRWRWCGRRTAIRRARPTATRIASPPTATTCGATTARPMTTPPRWRRPAPTRREFVSRVRRRVAGGGVCVCALDTELLGHWWYEGVAWLGAVLEECRTPGPGADDAR